MTPATLLERVQNAQQVEDQRDAIAALRQLVAEHPQDYELWNTLAQALIAVGDYHGALRAARKAIARNGGATSGYINAGIASRKLGNITAAHRFFSQAIAQDERDPLAHLHLARTAHPVGERHTAAHAYVEAIAYAAERDDIAALAIAGLGDLQVNHPSLPAPLHALIAAARAASTRSWTAVRLHVQAAIAQTTDAVTRDAAFTMLSLSWRNRERTPLDRPS